MQRRHREIKVQIPEGADLKKLESAVEEALKTKLTDATVRESEEITILITKFGKPEKE